MKHRHNFTGVDDGPGGNFIKFTSNLLVKFYLVTFGRWEDNLYDFLFTSLDNIVFPKGVYSSRKESCFTLLHLERPRLNTILAFLSAVGLKKELALLSRGANSFL